MGAIEISGTLTLGDACGVSACGSETGDTTIPLGFGGCCSRPAAVSAWIPSQAVASPAAFVTLPNVGPTATVKQADFLYLRANAAIEVRITSDDGAGGQVAALLPPTDFLMMTFSATRPLELLEVRGSATIAYLVSGPS